MQQASSSDGSASPALQDQGLLGLRASRLGQRLTSTAPCPAPFLGAGSTDTQPLRTDTSRPETNDHPRRRLSTGLNSVPSERRRPVPERPVHTACPPCSARLLPLRLPGAGPRGGPSDQTLHNLPPCFQPRSGPTCLVRPPSSPLSAALWSTPLCSPIQTLHDLYFRGICHRLTYCAIHFFIIIIIWSSSRRR